MALHTKLMAIHSGIVAQAPMVAKDALQFYERVERKSDNKQQIKGHCLACGKMVTSTASFRLVGHLLKCPLMPSEVIKDFQQIKKLSNDKICGKREAENQAAEEAALWASRRALSMKQLGIKGSMQGAEAAWADKCIAEFFYANAIPFGAACTESSGLYRRMISAIKATPAGYKPPNYNKLGGELLDSCYDGMWKSIKDRDPDGALMYKYGSTYVTDGWDSCDNLSLINSAFITKNDGGIFWRSVDTSGKIKCAEYTAALMIQDIYAYGPTKVVLVVTDTCSVMQKAWDIVMFEFPWISVLPCQPHVISLLLKDIGKTAEVRSMPSACAWRGCLSSFRACQLASVVAV